MIYSACKLNKQDSNMQPWGTPFPIWYQSTVPLLVLIFASWPAYRFLRRHVRWSGIPISLRIFHRISHKYTHVPSLLTLSSTLLGCDRVPGWAPCVIQQLSISYPFLHTLLYIFQCYSLNSSHPLLLLLCLQVCSLCFCFYSCSANRFISTIFLDFIYNVLIYNICFSLSDLLHSV